MFNYKASIYKGVLFNMKKILNMKNIVATNLLLFLVTSPAMAQLEKVNTIMEKVSTALQAAAVITVTVAVFWCGYKIVFGGQTFREVAPILIGGIVIGAASQIASMLVG